MPMYNQPCLCNVCLNHIPSQLTYADTAEHPGPKSMLESVPLAILMCRGCYLESQAFEIIDRAARKEAKKGKK